MAEEGTTDWVVPSCLAGHVAKRARLRWLCVSALAHRRRDRPSCMEAKWQEPMSRKDTVKSKRIKSWGGKFLVLNTQQNRYVMMWLKIFFSTAVNDKGGDL